MSQQYDIEQLIQELNAVKADNTIKHKIIEVLSHELRNPINAIYGMSQILMNMGNLDPAISKCIDVIYHASNKTLPLLDHSLHYLAEHDDKLEQQPLNLRSLIEDIAGVKYQQYQDKGLNLFIDYAEDIPRLVIADEKHLKTVFDFILDNAMRFTDKGNIFMEVVGYVDDKNNANYTMHITDSGCGITAEDLSGIFDLFTVDEEGNHYQNGGVKLSICKHILDLMAGDIIIDSKVNQGTTVTINLSLPVQENAVCANKSLWQSFQNQVKILIVNDDLQYGNLLYKYIPSASNRAMGMESAIALFQDDSNKESYFDIVILDEKTVECDHDRLSSLLMNLNRRKHMLFMVLTNDPQTKNMNMLKQEVTVFSLAKPVLPSQFVKQLSIHWLDFNNALHTTKLDSDLNFVPHILLVEDNAHNAKVETLMLKSLGCTVQVAESGEQAIQLYCTPDSHYDLILMDLGLPGKNGCETTLAMQDMYVQGERCPIVAMTAYASSKDKQQCYDVGMVEVITKPVSLDVLANKLQQYIPALQQENLNIT